MVYRRKCGARDHCQFIRPHSYVQLLFPNGARAERPKISMVEEVSDVYTDCKMFFFFFKLIILTLVLTITRCVYRYNS